VIEIIFKSIIHNLYFVIEILFKSNFPTLTVLNHYPNASSNLSCCNKEALSNAVIRTSVRLSVPWLLLKNGASQAVAANIDH